MNRKLLCLSTALLLLVISGAVAGRYYVPVHLEDLGLASFAAQFASSGPSPGSWQGVEPSPQDLDGAPASKPRAPATGTVDSDTLAAWIARQLERNPDFKSVRSQLEQALVDLPSEDDRESDEVAAAVASLHRAEQTAGTDYRSLMDQASRILERYPNGKHTEEALELFSKYAETWDEQEFREAMEFARLDPTNFAARLDHFQNYLDRHEAGGKHGAEVRVAIEETRMAWADHGYRELWEASQRYPNDLSATAERVRRFLEQHPGSRHCKSAAEFLARYEWASTRREYRVRVVSGIFDDRVGRALSLGPDLAVEVEVAGVKLGKTPIVADSYKPVWNYEYPQSIYWRLGDSVRIRVIDLDYGNRTILNMESAADDPIALRLLTGSVRADGHELTFECGFKVPRLAAP